MEKAEKYRRASAVNFTPDQLAQAQANYERSAKRFPEEHKAAAARIAELGLGNHREVVEWYLHKISPMPEHQIATIAMYADTSYAGAFGRGIQLEPAGATAPNASLISRGSVERPSPADNFYRQQIRPDGAS